MQPSDLDAILIAWHRWGDTDSSRLGYPAECPSTRGYRASNQWRGTDVDDAGDVYQTAPDPFVQRLGGIVDGIVSQMEQMQGLALAYQARALSMGTYAIRNPRLPQGDELAELIALARMDLCDGLELVLDIRGVA
jgi:hypothetical protein